MRSYFSFERRERASFVFARTTRVSNRIVQTNMQLLDNNDYEHASISTVGKENMFVYVGIIAVCYLSSLMNLIIDGGGGGCVCP